MATTFKVGDKVEHRTFGPGEITFGPFEHHGGPDRYLLKEEGSGTHALAVGEAMTLAAKFKIGDKVYSCGDEYTIKAGPFVGSVAPWYVVTGAAGVDYRVGERTMTLVEPTQEIKVGDRVRVRKDDREVATGEYVGKVGTVLRVGNSVRAELNYRVDFGDGDLWWVEDVELADESAADTYTHNGVTYDLTATYEDKDGDRWEFKRGPGTDGTPLGSMNGFDGTGHSYTLGYVVRSYSPLTRVDA